jgi:YbbR domain-containing protein
MKPHVTHGFLRDWPLKLVSLVLAVSLWLLLVPAEKSVTVKSLTIPLETLNIPAGLEIVEGPVATVDVTLRGPSRLLDGIGPSGLVARLDLERATVPQQEYPLGASVVDVPSGVDVVRVSPSKVTIKLERTVAATLEVRATLRGRPAAGYHVEGMEIDPATVEVRGPESRVQAKAAATTAPVDITGLTQPTIFEADIILPRPELRFVDPRTTARVGVHVVADKAGSKAPARKK